MRFRVVGYFEIRRRIVLTTPINPAMKRAIRLSLAPSSPLPLGAKNATAIRRMLKARKNRLANVCTALFMPLFPPSAARRLPRELPSPQPTTGDLSRQRPSLATCEVYDGFDEVVGEII